MKFSWDEAKRRSILAARGLDLADCGEMFKGTHVDILDDRFDYGELRFVTFGFLKDRLCCVVWTQRKETTHLNSLRKANDREQKKYRAGMD